MTLLQAIWMFASFFIGFYVIEYACAAIKARCAFGINLIFALLGVLVAYTVMFAELICTK